SPDCRKRLSRDRPQTPADEPKEPTMSMTQDELKALVGRAALAYVVPGSIVGVGTGSTVNCFIDALATMKDRIVGAVTSSERSTERLRSHGIAVLDSNAVEGIPVYFDGSDVTDHARNMI